MIHSSSGKFEVLPNQRLPDIFRGKHVGNQLIGVDVDVDRSSLTAHQGHRPDTLDSFEILFDRLASNLGDFAKVATTRNGDRRDRGGVDVKFVDERRISADRQSTENRGDLVAHLLGGNVSVFVEVKIDDDLREAFFSRRTQFVDAGNRIDDLFHFFRDRGFHLLNAGPFEGHRDHDHGQVDVGKKVDAQLRISSHSQHDRRSDQHECEDRPPNTDFPDTHTLTPGRTCRLRTAI